MYRPNLAVASPVSAIIVIGVLGWGLRTLILGKNRPWAGTVRKSVGEFL